MKIKRLACLSLALVSVGIFAVGCANGGVSGIPVNTVQTSDTSNMTYSDIIAKWHDIDSKQDTLDRQERDLKNKYINGQITKEEYTAQMSEIDRQKDELERQEDELEIRLEALKAGNNSVATSANKVDTTAATKATAATTKATATTKANTNAATKATAATKANTNAVTKANSTPKYNNSNLVSIKKRLNELDRQEDQLELKYERGQISRAEYISQKSKLEAEENALERQEDLLEGDFD